MNADPRKVPYAKPQPFGMQSDIFSPGALDLDAEDGLWVPQAEGVWFRPLVLNVSQGYYVNLLRVRRAGVLSRHRHAGPVHAFTLRGRWHYLEHDWEAVPGSYAFEPPGETHTLVVPDDVDDTITLFHVTGGYVYVDPQGVAEGYEDVFTKLDAARSWCAEAGINPERIAEIVK
ncbi:MAG: 2,4'-dihydroxyacetophenone dioxygenase family protein [Amaricoccus sp.]|uniref:2,4'-dihydroxyacetophenone dioxygenase family protein n=1 Tax=Amaricoccus sp. TaxID=1872485 RepID=UPI0039E6E32F